MMTAKPAEPMLMSISVNEWLELKSQRDIAAAALRDLFALMDEGYLVRDISRDGEEGFAMRQLPYVRRLAAAHSALAAAEAP